VTPIPQGPFSAILADPPWSFRTYGGKDVAPARAEQPYSVMSLADLKVLPVGDIVAKDAVLFMWTVSHLQDEATDVARAWGFTPKSVAFIWDKGRVGVRQLIRAPRREHSRKPDEQYERIEALVDGPYLELFARQAWPGWVSWGNQVDKFTPANDNAPAQAGAA